MTLRRIGSVFIATVLASVLVAFGVNAAGASPDTSQEAAHEQASESTIPNYEQTQEGAPAAQSVSGYWYLQCARKAVNDGHSIKSFANAQYQRTSGGVPTFRVRAKFLLYKTIQGERTLVRESDGFKKVAMKRKSLNVWRGSATHIFGNLPRGEYQVQTRWVASPSNPPISGYPVNCRYIDIR